MQEIAVAILVIAATAVLATKLWRAVRRRCTTKGRDGCDGCSKCG